MESKIIYTCLKKIFLVKKLLNVKYIIILNSVHPLMYKQAQPVRKLIVWFMNDT